MNSPFATRHMGYVFSVGVHLVFFAFLFINMESEQEPEKIPHLQPIVQATAVDESQLREAMEERKAEEQRKIDEAARQQREKEEAKQRKKEQAEQKQREKKAAEEKRLADLKKKQETEKRKKAEAEKKRKADETRKRQQAEENKRKAEEARERQQAEEKKRKEEAARKAREKAEREAAEKALQEKMAAEQKRLNAERAQLMDRYRLQYMAAIRDKVERNWRRPGSIAQGSSCRVLVTQIPGGEVMDVRASKCSSATLQRTVEAAVLRASPLPPPPDPAVFDREIEFVFEVR